MIKAFLNVNFSPWNTEKMYRQLLDSKRTLQAMENKVVSRFLLHKFWERQNYGTIRETAGNRWRKNEMILA